MSISRNYLIENDPRTNLRILAEFQPSDTAGTKCTTEKAYLKVPKTNISPSTLREIALITGGMTFLTLPYILTAGKLAECGSKLFQGQLMETYTCLGELMGQVAPKIQLANLLTLGSMVAFASLGAYSLARRCLQDKAKGERFEMLNREYSAAADTLLKQSVSQNRNERTEAIQMAKSLLDNQELIGLSLLQTARLTKPQADLLAAKIANAARQTLRISGV